MAERETDQAAGGRSGSDVPRRNSFVYFHRQGAPQCWDRGSSARVRTCREPIRLCNNAFGRSAARFGRGVLEVPSCIFRARCRSGSDVHGGNSLVQFSCEGWGLGSFVQISNHVVRSCSCERRIAA
jgi:hypothetical protein